MVATARDTGYGRRHGVRLTTRCPRRGGDDVLLETDGAEGERDVTAPALAVARPEVVPVADVLDPVHPTSAAAAMTARNAT